MRKYNTILTHQVKNSLIRSTKTSIFSLIEKSRENWSCHSCRICVGGHKK